MSSLTPTPTVSSIPSEGEGLSTGTILIIVGAVFSVLVVLLGAIYLTLVCRSRTQKVPITINKTLMKSSDINLDEVVEEDSNATIIEEKNVLSLPGYLELNPHSDMLKQKKLGEGGMGTIWLCEIKSSRVSKIAKSQFCVAKVSTKRLKEQSNEMKAFVQEVSITHFLKNQRNVVKLVGFSLNPPTIVLRYYSKGSLLNYIQTEDSEFEHSIQNYFDLAYGIAHGVCALHRQKIAHRDIKPANVLIESLVHPKTGRMFMRPLLTDFGISCPVDPDVMAVKNFQVITLNGASLRYAAPEVMSAFRMKLPLKISANMLKGDIYSYSIVLYEMLTRVMAWRFNPDKNNN